MNSSERYVPALKGAFIIGECPEIVHASPVINGGLMRADIPLTTSNGATPADIFSAFVQDIGSGLFHPYNPVYADFIYSHAGKVGSYTISGNDIAGFANQLDKLVAAVQSNDISPTQLRIGQNWSSDEKGNVVYDALLFWRFGEPGGNHKYLSVTQKTTPEHLAPFFAQVQKTDGQLRLSDATRRTTLVHLL